MTSKSPNWSFYLTKDAGGRQYVIASYSVWVPEKKQPRIAARKHVGRLQPDFSVKLGKAFLQAFPQYEGKDVFFWKNRLLSREEISGIPEYQEAVSQEKSIAVQEEAGKKEEDAVEARNACLQCGRSWVAWFRLKQSGILDDLDAVFGKDTGKILADLAVYAFSTQSGAMQNFEEWLYHTYLPRPEFLDGRRISEVLSRVTPDLTDAFFQRRHAKALAKAREEREELLEQQPELRDNPLLPPLQVALDSTSISTYSETIQDAEWGKNKQGESLKQINLCAVCDQSTGEILYAHEYPGSINDSSSFSEILYRMEEAKFDLADTLLVADRGYQTTFNVQELVNRDIRFVIGVPLWEDSVKQRFDRHASDLTNYAFMLPKHGIFAYTAGSDDELETWEKKLPNGAGKIKTSVFVHLYRNPILEFEKSRSLADRISEIVAAKNKGQQVDAELFKKYRKFLRQTRRLGQEPTWHRDNEQYAQACRKTGYFCIRSNVCASAEEALERYRQRQSIEDAFRRFKVYNDSTRLMSTQTAYRGRLFVFLLAESIRFMLDFHSRKNAEALSTKVPGNSLEKLLCRIDGVTLRRMGRGTRFWRPAQLSRRQRQTFELLGVIPPAGKIQS